jgi:chaperonin GroES
MSSQQSSLLDFDFLYDYVLVEATEEPPTADGLVNPAQYDDKPEFGIIVKCGPGRLMDDGTLVPLHVKQGDEVLFNKYGTSKIRKDGKDYLVIREYDIVGVVHA